MATYKILGYRTSVYHITLVSCTLVNSHSREPSAVFPYCTNQFNLEFCIYGGGPCEISGLLLKNLAFFLWHSKCQLRFHVCVSFLYYLYIYIYYVCVHIYSFSFPFSFLLKKTRLPAWWFSQSKGKWLQFIKQVWNMSLFPLIFLGISSICVAECLSPSLQCWCGITSTSISSFFWIKFSTL